MKYKKHILWKPNVSLLETFKDYVVDIKTYFTNEDGGFSSFRVNKKSQSVRFPEFMKVYDNNYPKEIYLEVVFAIFKEEELRICPFCGNVLYVRNVKHNEYYQVCSKACDSKLKTGCTKTPTKNSFFSTYYPGSYYDANKGYIIPNYCVHNDELIISEEKAKSIHKYGGSFCEECNKERFCAYNPVDLSDDLCKIKTILEDNKRSATHDFLFMRCPELLKSLHLYYKSLFPDYIITLDTSSKLLKEMKYCVTRGITQTPRCSYDACNAITKFTGSSKGYAKYCDKHRNLSFESQQEYDLFTICKKICPDHNIIRGDRTILSGYELDVYIPELNKAIEYNGIWFHSYPNKDKDYHYNKFKTARDKGVDVLFIWEDDFVYNTDNTVKIIENFLKGTDVVDYKETIKNIDDGEFNKIIIPNRPQYNGLYRYIVSNYNVEETVDIDSKIRLRYDNDNLDLLCYGTGTTTLNIKNRI